MSTSEEVHLSSLLSGWTSSELEYLAEDELVSVTPNFSQDVLPLLGCATTIGPFRPPLPTQVPLWLAIQLKKQKKAEILCPEWMKPDSLDQWLLEERATNLFIRPPIPAYIEVSRLLLHYAREDLAGSAAGVGGRGGGGGSSGGGIGASGDAAVALIEERLADIQDVRAAKIKEGLKLINENIEHIKLNNISTLELNTIRTFVTESLSKFQKLRQAAEASLQHTQSQSQGAGGGEEEGQEQAQSRRAATTMGAAQRNNLRQMGQMPFAPMETPQRERQPGAFPQTPAAASAASPSQPQPGAMPSPSQPSQMEGEGEGQAQARKLRRYH